MKHNNAILFKSILVTAGILLFAACTEKWEDHYNEDSFDIPEKTLKEYINEYPELSIFSEMLTISGYDNIIGASQSYTIWAPVNDALDGIDLTNTNLIREIVQNHIARSRYTTSGVESQMVRMLNGKYINFSRTGDEYTFGEKNITSLNIAATNGLFHIINGYVPYTNNLWEFIGRTQNLDSLRTYLFSQDKKIFDIENSTEIGVNDQGKAIYDSVFIYSNAVLLNIGSMNDEDSIYTAILPDNNAWSEAYNRIEKYYNFPDDAGSSLRQREMSQRTLVKDMLFRNRINQPELFDSLVSTTGNAFQNPSQLFQNTTCTPLSNGLACVTGQMPYIDTASWFKKIKVEAENSYGRVNSSSNIFLRYSYGSGFNVSDSKYILVDPTSSSSSVEFSIPNTLSAKYNIYCVFVPSTIVDPLNITPTKAKFELTYIRRASGSTFIKSITPANNTTNPIGLTKMFVDQFDFEFANVIDEEFDRVAVKVKVVNTVTSEEEQAGDYTRTMRIDCIILEPVFD
jgi:hypothetical protein